MSRVTNFRAFPRHLKIATLNFLEPSELFRIVTKDGRTVYNYDSKIIDVLSKVLGISYEVYAQDGLYPSKSLPNGTWPGLIGMLQRGEVDIALGGMGYSYERNKVGKFTFPHLFTDMIFITDKPVNLPKSFAIFYPFSWQVWLAILSLFLLMSYLLYEFMGRKYQFWNVLLTTLGSLLEQSMDFKVKRQHKSLKLLMLTWFVFVLLITSCYESLILASFSIPSLVGVRTIDDLSRAAKDKSFRCSTGGINIAYLYLLTSIDEKLNAIADCVTRNLDVSLEDFHNYMYNSTYKKAGIAARSYSPRYSRDFFISEESFFSLMVGMSVREHFCCRETLDIILHRMTAAGLFQKYTEERNTLLSLKGGTVTSQTDNRNITLDDVGGAFILLFVGEVFSTVVLLFEIIYWSRFQRRRTSATAK